MIESVRFKNYKALRGAVLPLSQVTVIVGPNGSGKTTALNALEAVTNNASLQESWRSIGVSSSELIEVEICWGSPYPESKLSQTWGSPIVSRGTSIRKLTGTGGGEVPPNQQGEMVAEIAGFRVFNFDPTSIARPVKLMPHVQLGRDGANLAGVLDRMRDLHPERFEALNQELARWLPEFDRVLFEIPAEGLRSFLLRVADGGHSVGPADLSEGTLLCLALLTLSYLPSPPTIIGLEEPDRCIHPRLLRDVQDAIYRLAHPDGSLDSRPPVQVIATTHNPYFLSLFRDHPEEVVIAEKRGAQATFQRLSKYPHIDEILQDAPLGDIWYTGILGGVPARS